MPNFPMLGHQAVATSRGEPDRRSGHVWAVVAFFSAQRWTWLVWTDENSSGVNPEVSAFKSCLLVLEEIRHLFESWRVFQLASRSRRQD